MFVAFSCKNFGSFRDQVVLSMEASSKDEYRDFNSFEVSSQRLLKSALIFGANGSGKSNFFKAILYMQSMVMMSVIDDKIASKNNYFRFSQNAGDCPSSFEIVLIDQGITYTYGFEIFKGKVIREWLNKKKVRTTTVFERSESNWDSIKLYGDWRKYEDLRKHTRENALFLTLAAMLNVPQALSVHEWFNNLMIISHDDDISPGGTIQFIEQGEEYKDLVLSFLKNADFGIDDFQYQVKEIELSEIEKQKLIEESELSLPTDKPEFRIDVKKRGVDVKTSHKIYDSQHQSIGTVLLPFLRYQSSGTIKLFELLGPILKTLMDGGVLFIDEIDSKLHPLIVRHILRLFHSLNANTGNGQLICNTHDVLLLEEDIRRDQIWFMQKDETGASELYSLSDFNNIRKNDPLLKKYLLGVFGAVPFQNAIKV